MTQFVKTTVPTEGYTQTKKWGDKYIVHLDPQEQEDGMTSCYETLTDTNPNIKMLEEELLEYKAWLNNRTEIRLKKQRMRDILEELKATDYLTSKYIDGEDMTQYGDWQAHRKALRAEYNEIQESIELSND